MKKLYENLNRLFLEDVNQSAFMAYEYFENYQSHSNMSIDDFLINFKYYIRELKDHMILFPEPVLIYKALKSVNLTSENERLVKAKATIGELTLSAMSEQLKKLFTDSILMLCHSSLQQSWWKMKWMLPTMKATKLTLVGYFMVAVLINTLIFLDFNVVQSW